MELFKIKIIAKVILFSVAYSFLVFSCQKQTKVIIPTEGIEPIDKGRLVFDIKLFNKHKEDDYSDRRYRARYEYKDEIGTNIFMFYDSLEYFVSYHHPDSLLGQYYRYYPNGQLKFKANEFLRGNFFLVGKEYHYDLNGNIEKIINNDTIFNVPLSYVFEFMNEKGIDFEKDVTAISKNKAYYNDAGELLEPNEWRIYTEERIWRINADTGEEILKILQWDYSKGNP